MSRADAAARALIDQYGLGTLPVDPEKVAANLGATVIQQPGPAELSGMLLRRNNTVAIGINEDLSTDRQRFVVAHLIGHLRLHRSRELILDTAARYRYGSLSSMPTDREEAEANRFAAALLAPEAVVRRVAKEIDADTADQMVDLLASQFQLTRTAMTYRLMSLGITLDAG
ncbi:ImmA/IrrE family metallo-endopeptidase [Streptomyces griseorubiginosus]|uniref:ImmA/IrrE family metallo-endopeptidase n=1 Tax=Streptomyces griseorubiginosus TaxID=67304 RepID=UPI0033C7BFD5